MDISTVFDLLDYDATLLREFIDLVLADCAKHLTSLRTALTRRDGKALALTAHSIKGSVGNFAAGEAVAAAAALETIACSGDLAHADAACQRLEEEVARLVSELAAFTLGLNDSSPTAGASAAGEVRDSGDR